MKAIAVGRHLLVRLETEAVEEITQGGIHLPKKVTDKQKAGIQLATVLSVGEYAFDDQDRIRQVVVEGCTIITDRYAGAGLDFDPNSTDMEAAEVRAILDTEVRGVVTEEGVDV